MKSLAHLPLYRMFVLEMGQHVKSIINGIDDLGENFITDPLLQNYMNLLKSSSAEYDKAMLKIMKSDETAKISAADDVRDKAIAATLRILSAFELSDNETELQAYFSLHNLFNTYKGIQKWNFEEESNGIDNLLVDLSDPKYTAHIATVSLSNYISRIQTANEHFKTLFAGRIHETATKEVFDTKVLRADLTTKYTLMTEYVLNMARATDTDLYNLPLNIINTVRKYYADLLAKRKGTKTEESTEPIPPMTNETTSVNES